MARCSFLYLTLAIKTRTAIKTELFADDHHRKTVDALGDPLAEIASDIDFAALAQDVDRVAPQPVSPQGGQSAVSD